MEGLGAAVELTVKITSLCAEYSSAVKNASHDIQSLRERISSLETTLKDVMELLESSQGARLRTSQKLHDALNNSRLLLDSIATTLENKLNGGRGQRTMRAFGLRALKWPFESKKLENIMAGLEQHQNTMVVAMQIDQTYVTIYPSHFCNVNIILGLKSSLSTTKLIYQSCLSQRVPLSTLKRTSMSPGAIQELGSTSSLEYITGSRTRMESAYTGCAVWLVLASPRFLGQ